MKFVIFDELDIVIDEEFGQCFDSLRLFDACQLDYLIVFGLFG